jgi:hypothetical protein
VSGLAYGRPMRSMKLCVLALLAAAALATTARADERALYRVVAFGDSYAAGEGAPGTPGVYDADGTDPHPRAVWSGTATDTGFTGDTETGVLGARRCHRSPRATAPRAVKALASRFPDIDFTLRSFACSGAKIDVGVMQSYDGAEDIDPDHKVPAQIQQANDYLATLPAASRRIDALVMNIGGNNLGFADVIKRCTGIPIASGDCQPPASHDAENMILTGAGTDRPDETGLDDVPGLYNELAGRLDRTASSGLKISRVPDHVFLTGVPNPLAGDFGGCASLTGPFDYENRISPVEIPWLTGTAFPTLNGAFSAGAGTRWTFVSTEAAVPRGMCAANSAMLNRNRDALRTQGANVAAFGAVASVSGGWVHPNASGYAAMGPLLADAMDDKVITDFTPTAAPVSAAPAPVVDLLPRVELTMGDANTNYPTRPAGQQLDEPTNAVGAGVGDALVDVPVREGGSTTLQARRCGPLPLLAASVAQGCGPARNVAALIGTPSAPTSVSSTTDDLGLHVTWVKGSTVALRRFHVTATYSGLDKGGIAFPPAAVAESPIPTPSGQITQDERTITLQEKSVPLTMQFSFSAATREAALPAPDGRSVSVTVRECTDRGCGPGRGTGVARAGGASAQLQDALDRQFVQQQMLDFPIGVFSMRTGLTARPDRTYGLLLSWGTWRRWRDLSELRLRLRGRDGLLATLRVGLHSGRLVLSQPGGHARQARIGRRGTLRTGALALAPRDTRIVPGGPRSRLVALRLPLKVGRALRGQRIDVEVGAVSRTGRAQGPRWAGSFDVRR